MAARLLNRYKQSRYDFFLAVVFLLVLLRVLFLAVDFLVLFFVVLDLLDVRDILDVLGFFEVLDVLGVFDLIVVGSLSIKETFLLLVFLRVTRSDRDLLLPGFARQKAFTFAPSLRLCALT